MSKLAQPGLDHGPPALTADSRYLRTHDGDCYQCLNPSSGSGCHKTSHKPNSHFFAVASLVVDQRLPEVGEAEFLFHTSKL